MKKRIILLLLCVLTLTVSLCLFTACDEPETPDNGGTEEGGKEPCTHSYTSAVTKEAGCETTGTLTYTCSLCGDSYTETIAAKGHSHSTELSSDATHHYYLCACGDKKDKAAHVSSGPATATEDEKCTVCGYVITPAVGISFKTLTVTGNTVYGKVSNETEYFSFINEIKSSGGAKYIVSTNITGTQEIPAKTIELTVGDNKIYIIELINDEPSAVYTVTVRRRPIYEVTFDTNGGSAVETQYIEEDSLAVEPTTSRAGYTFASWSYDFSTPITDNTEITANWNANGNTPYKVEYYFENVNKNGYDLISSETINTTGQTDTTAYAPEKTFDHFTINKSMGTLSGNIDGEGTLVLKVYYTRNTYSISALVNNSKGGSVTGSGTYAYEKRVTLTATTKPGYTFLGWYEGETKVCSELTYSFNVDRAVTYTAKWTANTNTPYKVEYYRQNVNRNGYDLISSETINTIGQTDTTAYAPEKTFDHFTIDKTQCTLSGNIDGEGTLVLKVYYTRNTYTVSNANTSYGSITGAGTYAYGSTVTVTATPPTVLGYEFSGWYSGSECISTETTYTFTVENNVEARFEPKAEMSNFKFTSTATTCEITGIKDKTLTEIIVPDYVTSINEGAFSGCSKLEKITIPFVGGSRKTSSDTYQYPFGYIFGTSSYTGGTATRQYYYGSSTSSITYSTYYIPSTLKSVTVTGGNILYGAFESCSSLTSVEIPNSVKTIGDRAFSYCSSLTSVVIGNSVTSIGYMAFYYCDSLTSVTIPNSVTSIGSSAFGFCDSLTSITVAEENTKYKSIDGNLYSKDGKTLIQYAIGKTATSFTIPDSVTSIGAQAFLCCTSLTSVTIPNSVTSIGAQAFYGCYSLTSIKYRGTETQWNAISKGSSWNDNTGNYTITYNYTVE